MIRDRWCERKGAIWSWGYLKAFHREPRSWIAGFDQHILVRIIWHRMVPSFPYQAARGRKEMPIFTWWENFNFITSSGGDFSLENLHIFPLFWQAILVLAWNLLTFGVSIPHIYWMKDYQSCHPMIIKNNQGRKDDHQHAINPKNQTPITFKEIMHVPQEKCIIWI